MKQFIWEQLKKCIGRPVKQLYTKFEDNFLYKNYTRIIHDDLFCEVCLRKQKAFDLNKENIEVIGIRGSHCDYSIIPECFDKKTFNFGLTSMDFFGAYHLYKNISITSPKLKYIIVFYNFSMNGFDLSKTKEKWRCSYYNKLFGIPYPVDMFRISDLKKLDKYFKKFKNKIKQTDESFLGYYEPMVYVFKDGKQRVQGHLKNFLRNDMGLFWLEQMYKLSKAQNHILYLVIPPFSMDFIKYLDKKYHDIALQKLYEILPKNQIFDFLYDKYDIDDFGDTDHFTKKGAIKFSRLLSKIINDTSVLE